MPGCVVTVAPDLIPIGIAGIATVVMAIAAVSLKNLVHAVVAFAAGSAFLAALFFLLSSPFAGALELTVGAGLVSVLFLVALLISGNNDMRMVG